MVAVATLGRPTGFSRGPRRLLEMPDGMYRGLLGVVAAVFTILLVAFGVSMALQARPAFAHFGFSFFTSTKWDPVHVHLGALTFLVGTLETTFIAMLVAVPIGLGCALALAFGVPERLRMPLGTAVELLAAVPSVVYGLWGLLVLAPWVRKYVEPLLAKITAGHFPFGGTQLGQGLLLAGLVLSVMVLPTMVAISRDVILAVPATEIEAAFALGATRWQVMRKVVLPGARTGILGATTLATGRALGETIAVTMVIGNTPALAHSLFSTAQTMASVIANEFTEATEPFHKAALVAVGVLLLVVSLGVNLAARLLVRSIGRQRALGAGMT